MFPPNRLVIKKHLKKGDRLKNKNGEEKKTGLKEKSTLQ